MAVKKSRRARHRKNSSGESASEARLAPPEERGDGAGSHQFSNDDGALVLNTGRLKLPQQIEEEEGKAGFLTIDPAVLTLLCLSLIFIVAIAFIIWNGWEPPQ